MGALGVYNPASKVRCYETRIICQDQNLYILLTQLQFWSCRRMSGVGRYLRPLALPGQSTVSSSHRRLPVSTLCIHSPTVIHVRRAFQIARLLVYLTLLNWYKWTLSRTDINLASASFSLRSFLTATDERSERTCRGRQIFTPSCERIICMSTLSVSILETGAAKTHLPPMC